MEIAEQIIRIFRERENQPMRVFFGDGEIYDLQILSTLHFEEGGDVVAHVIKVIASNKAGVWDKASMNFRVKDVSHHAHHAIHYPSVVAAHRLHFISDQHGR